MLRECIRFESLAKIILSSPDFYRFFQYVEGSAFDIASDAFSSFKVKFLYYCWILSRHYEMPHITSTQRGLCWFQDLLSKHKIIVAEFLSSNYDKFFQHYQRLLDSDNYVTRRQSLKVRHCFYYEYFIILFIYNLLFIIFFLLLFICNFFNQLRDFFQLLGELLLDRHNFNVMTKYIGNPENLKLMMIMLREKSRNIQFEAFHVFKVGWNSSIHVFFVRLPVIALPDALYFLSAGICCQPE